MKQTITSIIIAIIMALLSISNANAQISVFGTDNEENPGGWDFSLPFVSITNQPDPFHHSLSSAFSVGFIGGVNQAEGVNIDMGHSIELEWSNVISAKARIGRNNLVRIGLSLDWRNYRMTNGNMFNKDEQTQQISIDPFNKVLPNVEPKFSRVHTFSLSVPIKYYQRIGKYVVFAVGPELYYTPYGSIKNRYYEDGNKVKKGEKVLVKNIHQKAFSVGVGAEVNVCGIGVYYKYNPFNVLNTDYGPKFQSMTVGIKVGM